MTEHATSSTSRQWRPRWYVRVLAIVTALFAAWGVAMGFLWLHDGHQWLASVGVAMVFAVLMAWMSGFMRGVLTDERV